MQQYDQLLASKIKVADRQGITVDITRLHPSTRPDQAKIIPWALERGNGLIGADAGLGKTHLGIETMRILHEDLGGKCLVVTELGATDTWVNEDPEIGEGARLGVKMEYVTNTQQAFQSDCYIVVTNYERVRNGDINFGAFTAVWLDEGNYVKNMASETTDMLSKELAKVKYKYIATATPCPNEYLELINYAHVLGICDRGQILTRFFQRNSTKAGELTLHEQHEDDFWMWVYSWAVFITEPADLGFDNGDFILPKLIVNWHEVPMDISIEGGTERDGQKKIFADSSNSLPEASRIKRESIMPRIAYATNLMLAGKNEVKDITEHYLIWHHLEAERLALKQVFKDHPNYGEIFGKQDWTIREKNIVDFSNGHLQILGTKPDLSGVGCNFQKHCYRAIALGVNHSWDEFYQAIIKRLLRPYGKADTVIIDVLYVREEVEIVNNIKEKWRLHDEMRDKMKAIVRKYGLEQSKFIEERKRSFVQDRKEWIGENYTLIKNDCVYEWQQMPDNSIDMILSSYPFGNHYEYTDKYNDFGHNSTNAEFFAQMDYLIPELLRTLKPGRIAAIHLKNRIHYGSVTGKGFSTFHRFTHAVCDAMEKHGFDTLGFHYVPTCVVGENTQTYRLTFGELLKDATKMGSGIPEEIWLFRKAPTSSENAYADEPVIHDREYYTLANWQIDADAFWGSSGNRYITPDELSKWDLKHIRAWWNKFNAGTVYDYDKHVKLLQDLDSAKKLSRSWTTLPLRSNSPYIWNDVNRMHGLNMEQSRRKQRNHICPMPFDEVNRLIELYTNPGELVADPFGGIGTTGVCAVKKGRRALITELNDTYAETAGIYLRETEMKREIPTLFDLINAPAA